MSLATLLLLADGRFPAGGHAHSGGLEAAVARSRVRDLDTLHAFLAGRLATAGLVAAAFAAAARVQDDLAALEGALDARTPSGAMRRAARQQGRALCRAALVIWPSDRVRAASRCSHAIALGVVAGAAGLGAAEAASIAAYSSISGPASAAVRLLGLDPYRVHALLAALAGAADATASRGLAYAGGPIDELPAASAPLLDLSAEDHAAWEVRLFAS